MMEVSVIETESIASAVSSLGSNASTLDERPLRTIQVPTSQVDRKEAFLLSSTTEPYAQLCYDPHHSTLVAIMETRRKGQRAAAAMTPEAFPSFLPTPTVETTSSSSSSVSCASTVTLSTLTDRRNAFMAEEETLPFVLGTEPPDSLYLLHESGDFAPEQRRDGCTRAAFQKFSKLRPLGFLELNKRKHQKHKNKPIRLAAKHGGYQRVRSEASFRPHKWK